MKAFSAVFITRRTQSIQVIIIRIARRKEKRCIIGIL